MLSLPSPLADLLSRNDKFEETTLQGYRSAWRDLLDWIRENQPSEGTSGEGSLGDGAAGERVLDDKELPSPALIAEYLRNRMDLSWSTLTTRRQAFRHVYREFGEGDPFGHPEVEEVWDRIVDEKRGEPSRPEEQRLGKRDLSPADIIENGPGLLSGHLGPKTAEDRGALKYLPEETARSDDLSAAVRTLIPEPAFELSVLRDRAILLLIATTNRPRKGLVGIDLEDIIPPEEEGDPTRIVVYDAGGDPTCVLRLETGPEIRYCPNRAVAAWILAAGLESGPLFRPFNPRGGIRGGRIRPQTLNLVTKRRAEEAGFDPDDWSTTKLREHD